MTMQGGNALERAKKNCVEDASRNPYLRNSKAPIFPGSKLHTEHPSSFSRSSSAGDGCACDMRRRNGRLCTTRAEHERGGKQTESK